MPENLYWKLIQSSFDCPLSSCELNISMMGAVFSLVTASISTGFTESFNKYEVIKNLMLWLSWLSDLNLVEHHWEILDRRARQCPLSSKSELREYPVQFQRLHKFCAKTHWSCSGGSCGQTAKTVYVGFFFNLSPVWIGTNKWMQHSSSSEDS